MNLSIEITPLIYLISLCNAYASFRSRVKMLNLLLYLDFFPFIDILTNISQPQLAILVIALSIKPRMGINPKPWKFIIGDKCSSFNEWSVSLIIESDGKNFWICANYFELSLLHCNFYNRLLDSVIKCFLENIYNFGRTKLLTITPAVDVCHPYIALNSISNVSIF